MLNIVTNKVVKLLGKVENIERFLRVALYQGRTQGSIAIPEEMFVFVPIFIILVVIPKLLFLGKPRLKMTLI